MEPCMLAGDMCQMCLKAADLGLGLDRAALHATDWATDKCHDDPCQQQGQQRHSTSSLLHLQCEWQGGQPGLCSSTD